MCILGNLVCINCMCTCFLGPITCSIPKHMSCINPAFRLNILRSPGHRTCTDRRKECIQANNLHKCFYLSSILHNSMVCIFSMCFTIIQTLFYTHYKHCFYHNICNHWDCTKIIHIFDLGQGNIMAENRICIWSCPWGHSFCSPHIRRISLSTVSNRVGILGRSQPKDTANILYDK